MAKPNPNPFEELNVRHALLGGLALLAGRVAVLPVLNCSGVADGFLQPGALPSRRGPRRNRTAHPDRRPCR